MTEECRRNAMSTYATNGRRLLSAWAIEDENVAGRRIQSAYNLTKITKSYRSSQIKSEKFGREQSNDGHKCWAKADL